MKLIRKNNKKGFTLVELIVVIAILAILALILIPAISGYTMSAKKSALEASARSLYSKAVLNEAEGKKFSEGFSDDIGKFIFTPSNDGENWFTLKDEPNKLIVTVKKSGVVGQATASE